MKPPKPNNKLRRTRKSCGKKQRSKSLKNPKSNIEFAIREVNPVIKNIPTKTKSLQEKLQRNDPLGTQGPKPTSTFCKPQSDALYSDVLFSGKSPSTLVKIKSLPPKKAHSKGRISKSHLKIKKSAIHLNREESKEIVLQLMNEKPSARKPQKTVFQPSEDIAHRHDSSLFGSTDLNNCVDLLTKNLDIQIPSWNFTDFGALNEFPRSVCQFSDYNYLACESAAFAGLRLASDGKFRF